MGCHILSFTLEPRRWRRRGEQLTNYVPGASLAFILGVQEEVYPVKYRPMSPLPFVVTCWFNDEEISSLARYNPVHSRLRKMLRYH